MQIFNLSKMGRFLFLMFVIGLVSVSFSCKKSSEKVSEKLIEKSFGNEADVDIDTDREKISIETEDGSYTMDASAKVWPKEIPNAVPKFKEGDLLTVSNMKLPEGENWTVMYDNVSISKVDAYKEALQANGFTIQSTIKMGEGTHITAEKDGLMVMIMAGEGKASLTIAQEK